MFCFITFVDLNGAFKVHCTTVTALRQMVKYIKHGRQEHCVIHLVAGALIQST